MIKLEKNHLLKLIFAFILPFLLFSNQLISEKTDLSVSQILTSTVFGTITTEYGQIQVLVLENLVFIILFNLIYSNLISQQFRYSCVYVFSRIKNRTKWYLSRLVEISIYAFFYLIIYFTILILFGINHSNLGFEPSIITSALKLFVFSFLLIIDTVTIINILTLKLGNVASFFIVQAGLILLVFVSMTNVNNMFLTAINPVWVISSMNDIYIYQIINIVSNLFFFVAIQFINIRFINKYDVAMFDFELN